MKYVTYDIVFKEIPDETSLAISLSNCPGRCENCHSPELRDDIGMELTINELDKILYKYNNEITCLLLMGGDNNIQELIEVFNHVRKKYKIKTAWYSGKDFIHLEMIVLLDFIKIGSYKKLLGGLDSPTTNQRLYSINNGLLTDITKKFLKNKENNNLKENKEIVE